jgi:hypothetical protein
MSSSFRNALVLSAAVAGLTVASVLWWPEPPAPDEGARTQTAGGTATAPPATATTKEVVATTRPALTTQPRADLPAVHPLPRIEPALKRELLDLPLSQLFPPLGSFVEGSREKLDADGVVVCDYSAYGVGWGYNPEAISRAAIRALNTYLTSDDPYFLALFKRQLEWLADHQRRTEEGLWQWTYDFDYRVNDVYSLDGPWGSAMAQGTAIAALARGYRVFGDRRYLDIARRSLPSFRVEVSDGGFRRKLSDQAWWYEEYPTPRPSYVLNGFVVALLGLWEGKHVLPAEAGCDELIDKGIHALDRLLPQFIIRDEKGYVWSRYDLAVKAPVGLLRLLPPKRGKGSVRVAEIALTDGREPVLLDVGAEGDTDVTGSHVLHNPEYQTWGPRQTHEGKTCRAAFLREGKYGHAPFRLRLPETEGRPAVAVTYAMGESGGVPVEAHDGDGYVRIGTLTGPAEVTGDGPWVTASFPLPETLLTKIQRRAFTHYNIAKAYHDTHVVLLHLLDRHLGLGHRYAPAINLWLESLPRVPRSKRHHLLEVWADPDQRPEYFAGYPPLDAPDDSLEKPPHLEGAAFYAGFGRRFVTANPPELNARIWRSQREGEADFRRRYADLLRVWLVRDLADLSGRALGRALKGRILATFEDYLPELRKLAPGLAEDELLMVHVMQLVHGHYVFATTPGKPESAGHLLRKPTGDCSELGRAAAALASLFRDDVEVVNLWIDYQTEAGLMQGGHCIFATPAGLYDPTVNMAVALDWPNLRDEPAPVDFAELLEERKVILLHNRYLQPARRSRIIAERKTDAGVLTFYYPWYMRGFGRGEFILNAHPVPAALHPLRPTGAGTGP